MIINDIKAFEVNGKLFRDKNEVLAYYIQEELYKLFKGESWHSLINKLAKEIDFREKVVKVLNTTVSKEEDVVLELWEEE